MHKTYTAFCQEATGEGTIWIDAVQARNLEEARLAARSKCATDWDYSQDMVQVLGIAAGDVNILEWEDICDIGNC